MSHTLYIVIADEKGDTVFGQKEEIENLTTNKHSKSLKALMDEAYPIRRIIEDTLLGKRIKRELGIKKSRLKRPSYRR